MNDKKPLPKIVVFAVLTVITTFVWIGFEVYRTLTKDPSPSVPPEIIAELDPNLDTETLARLTQGVHLEESQIQDTEITNIDSAEPDVENLEEDIPPVEQEEVVEATDEGEIVEEEIEETEETIE